MMTFKTLMEQWWVYETKTTWSWVQYPLPVNILWIFSLPPRNKFLFNVKGHSWTRIISHLHGHYSLLRIFRKSLSNDSCTHFAWVASSKFLHVSRDAERIVNSMVHSFIPKRKWRWWIAERNDIIWATHVLSEHVSKIFSSPFLIGLYACPLPRAPEFTAQPKSFLIYFFIPADVSKSEIQNFQLPNNWYVHEKRRVELLRKNWLEPSSTWLVTCNAWWKAGSLKSKPVLSHASPIKSKAHSR